MIRYISQSWTLAKIAPLNWAFHECKNTTFSQDSQRFCDFFSFCEDNSKIMKWLNNLIVFKMSSLSQFQKFANVLSQK